MRRLRFLRHVFSDVSRAVRPAPHHPRPGDWPSDQLSVAWLGHATVLINFYGVKILTDPVFFDRIGLRFGPITLGPKRYIECALRPHELPPIDLLLLSHAHMDHFDIRSIRTLNRDCIVVTAEHNSDLLPRRRFREVYEMPWNTERRLETKHGDLAIAAFKLRHWGARLQWDVHRGYNAYVLERNGRRICFCGDTAHTDARALGSRGPIDLLIVPISAYNPWITNHCTPEEAIEMAGEAGARFVMPVHHQTFKLSWEPMDEPLLRFEAALPKERVALREIGEEFVLEDRERQVGQLPTLNSQQAATK